MQYGARKIKAEQSKFHFLKNSLLWSKLKWNLNVKRFHTCFRLSFQMGSSPIYLYFLVLCFICVHVCMYIFLFSIFILQCYIFLSVVCSPTTIVSIYIFIIHLHFRVISSLVTLKINVTS